MFSLLFPRRRNVSEVKCEGLLCINTHLKITDFIFGDFCVNASLRFFVSGLFSPFSLPGKAKDRNP